MIRLFYVISSSGFTRRTLFISWCIQAKREGCNVEEQIEIECYVNMNVFSSEI